MKYGVRIAVVILIWIVSLAVLTGGLVLFAFDYSVESNKKTVSSVMEEVQSDLSFLMADDAVMRVDFDEENLAKGRAVRILQDYGQEKTVPDSRSLKGYMKLFGASYIAVIDPDGKIVSETGEKSSGSVRLVKKSEDTDLQEVFDLITRQTQTAGFETRLKDGYTLYYEMDYTSANEIADSTFSWKTLLQKVSLPDNAYFTVISKYDGTVLVHPDEELVGRNISELGVDSPDDLEKLFSTEDEDGIRWTGDILELSGEDTVLLDSAADSAIIELTNVYLICSVTEKTFFMYVTQTINTLLVFFGIGTLLVVLYIIFYLTDRRRKEREAAPDNYSDPAPVKKDLGSFCIDSGWAKRLGIVCIIVFLIVTAVAVQFQLLSNLARNDADKTDTERMVKEAEKYGEEIREQLDEWYSSREISAAELAAYVVQSDDILQTRNALKRINKELGLTGVYLFGQDGRVRTTSTTFDHIDLNKDKDSIMSKTFLQLLDGVPSNACTPLSGQDSGETLCYAGVSVRNNEDLCDGCVGITKELQWLVSDDGTINMYEDIIRLNSMQSGGHDLITVPQIKSAGYLMLVLAAALLLMFMAGTLERKRRSENEELKDADAGSDAAGEHARDKAQSSENGGGKSEDSESQHNMDFEEWFFTMAKDNKDAYFYDRWHIDMSSILRRSPESKVMTIIRILIYISAAAIVFLFLTNGFFGSESSVVNNLFDGSWKQGFNLYSVTAAEMVVIVAVAAAMILHRIIFLIASFCSQRGETICILISSLTSYAMVFIAAFCVMKLFGIDPRTMLVSAGVLGIVIGFGANTMIADILAGIFLIFEDVLHVGDFVKIGDNYGMVMSIGIRMTKIQYYSDITSINNSELKGIKNLYGGDARVVCMLPVDNTEDLTRVEEVIKQELPMITETIKKRVPIIGDVRYDNVDSIEEHAYKLRFIVFCTPYRQRGVKRLLYAELLKMAGRNHIKTVHEHVVLEQSEDIKEQ